MSVQEADDAERELMTRSPAPNAPDEVRHSGDTDNEPTPEPTVDALSITHGRVAGVSPLLVAVRRGELHAVKELLANDAAINAPDGAGVTPLYAAAEEGCLEVVRVLVEHHAIVNVVTNDRATALCIAAAHGHRDVVQLLLENEATVYQVVGSAAPPLYYAVRSGQVEIVRMLLENRAQVNTTLGNGLTPLFVAAENGHADVVRVLLESQATVDSVMSDGATPLFIAAQNGHLAVIQLLLAFLANGNLAMHDGQTPLLIASRNGHLDIVRLLLGNGAVVDSAMNNGATPLYVAAWCGHLDVVRALVDNHATVNSSMNAGSTPLLIAAENGHLKVVRLLLENEATVDAFMTDGSCPLYIACANGHTAVVRLLLEKNATVDIVVNDGGTPLFVAAQNGHLDVVRLLLENKATVDMATNAGVTPLFIAARMGHLDIVRLLLDNETAVNATMIDGNCPLFVASESGHFDVVRLLLESGARVDMAKSNGATPLLVTAQNGHLDIVKLLLESQASVDSAMKNGVTPLISAAGSGHPDVVRLLLKNNASVDMTTSVGATLLHVAAEFGHLDVVRLLLESQAAVDTVMNDGATPLYLAAQNGHLGVVRLLLEHHATVDLPMNDGETPLIMASENGHLDVVRLLLDYHAATDSAMDDGRRSLHVASAEGHSEVISLLLAKGARVDSTVTDGSTALHIGAEKNHLNSVQALLKNDAAVNAKNNDGITPLHLAAWSGYAEVVRVLLANHADFQIASLLGETSLLEAASEGHLEVAAVLVEYGATVDATTNDAVTPLHIASANNRLEIVALLLERNAGLDNATNEGQTPLQLASFGGHARVVERLLLSGAQIDAADLKGDTSLITASRRGHLNVVQQLLKVGASVCTVNEAGETAVLAAASSSHFDVVQVLIEAGASTDVQTIDGDTVLIFTAQWGSLNTVSQLITCRSLAFSNSCDGRGSLLRVTLEAMSRYGEQVHEFKRMWEGVVARLVQFYDYACNKQGEEADQRAAVHQFVMIIFHLIRLVPVCAADSVIIRLAASRTLVDNLHDLHMEINFLERSLYLEQADGLDSDWASTFEKDQVELIAVYQEVIDDDDAQMRLSLKEEADQVEAISLLQYEISANSGKYNPEILTLMRHTLDRAIELSSIKGYSTPVWFIPPHEIDVDKARDPGSEESSRLAQGKWLDSAVMIREYQDVQRNFVEEVDRWSRLSHPNVIKLFGASHLRGPYSAVFENVASTNLRDYLSAEENRHLLWKKFYEVARGLKYLHERGIFTTDLRCDHVWVGTDGSAKINLLGSGENSEPTTGDAVKNYFEDVTESVRWRAPECIRGEAPSSASNVFSLGMCMIEAMTGVVPWANEENVALVAYNIVSGYRPDCPDSCSSSGWVLVQKMLLDDTSKRANISTVVGYLKQFASQKKTPTPDTVRRPSVETKSGVRSLNLGAHVFPELSATIGDFLEKLEWKCGSCLVSRDSVLHIFHRLRDVYQLLIEAHKTPSDFVVKNYCQVLLSLDRFSRTAVSATSVLQVAKSQKVTLRSNVFHRDIDDLLGFLSVQNADPIHDWTPDEFFVGSVLSTADSGGKASGSELECSTSRNEAVNIMRFETSTLNQKFQQVHLDAVDEGSDDEERTTQQQQPWLIPIHELKYNRDTPIGVGAFGEVYKAKWLSTPVVVKFMGYEADGDEYSREMFAHELRVWYPLNHPHVIKLYGACHVGKRYFVCEFAGNGTISQYLARDKNEEQIWRKLYEVALGLQYLHEQNIVHNDLKCDNILVGADGDAKITDFGLSCIPNSAEVKVDQKRQGAQQWKSPEYLRGDRLTLASDIYGFGMCILEAVTGRPPWGSTSDVFVRNRVKKGILPGRPEKMSVQQWSLIEMVCASEPSKRVTVSSVVYKLQEFSQQQEFEVADALLAEATAGAP